MKIPVATYRLQFNPSLLFEDAVHILEYLKELGISDIYASPVFLARTGSLHGYDVVDQREISLELGGQEGFEKLMTQIRGMGLGWIQDMVPNHMAFDSRNKMLMDILEQGEQSKYCGFFDIDWKHPDIMGKILAPFLGRFYGRCLEDKEIQLAFSSDGFTFDYYDFHFPLSLKSYETVLGHGLGELREKSGPQDNTVKSLEHLIMLFRGLPSWEETGIRYEKVHEAKQNLWDLFNQDPDVRRYIEETISLFNGIRGDAESFNFLDRLLQEQYFRFSFWKVGTEELNYRRFFNINELISLKVEEEKVFNEVHSLLFKLFDTYSFTGVRVDHIDGLFDPTVYLNRLRQNLPEAYVIVEKILDFREEIPRFWPIQGTTGYDFLNFVNSLFCDTNAEKRMTRVYSFFTNDTVSFSQMLSQKKRLIIGKHMAGDVENLAHMVKNILGRDRHGRDVTMYGLKRAIVEIMAQFSVYRTYINAEGIRTVDLSYIREAVRKARQSNPEFSYELNMIEKILLLDFGEYLSQEDKKEWISMAMRLQQFTGPLMAKGFEDTVLYVYNRLISLNEVGGSPDVFGVTRREFEDFLEKRSQHQPHTMNATSTHDCKRGEDARMRINVLSEIPQEWEARCKLWSKLNRKKKKKVERHLYVPDKNDEYFLYQTLVGSWPTSAGGLDEYVKRLKSYIIKAVREAKVHTAWIQPDDEYEKTCLEFIDQLLEPREDNYFYKELLSFQKKISHYGIFNSLSQIFLKMTAPGVPDFYQGTELWDLSFVDPDNRMSVDFGKRHSILREICEKSHDLPALIAELLSCKEDGRIKLFLISRILKARNENPSLFQKGSFLPVKAEGKYKNHIISYIRSFENMWAVVSVPRFLTGVVNEQDIPVGERWEDASLLLPGDAPDVWESMVDGRKITGEVLEIGEIFKHFPGALLLGRKQGVLRTDNHVH